MNEYSRSLCTKAEDEILRELLQKLGDEAAANLVLELNEDCLVYDTKESLREASIRWAVNQARHLYHDTINNLLMKHPVHSLDEDGEPFWSGTRRTPTPLEYDSNDDIASETKQKINQNLIDFVRFAARLRIESYNTENGKQDANVSVEDAKMALQTLFAIGAKKSLSVNLAERLQEPKKYADKMKELAVATFEKDDDSNGHVDFVTAASNLRALCYQISPADKMETRKVAGRIVPAMVTTTALVSLSLNHFL